MKVKDLMLILSKMPSSAVIYKDDNYFAADMLREVEYDELTNEVILR